MTGLTAEASARTVARGARVNALGVIARLAQPLALILLTRWYGPDQVGVYLLSIAVVETVAALAGSGMQDALIAFLSPLDPASPRAHRLLASGFVLAGAGAAAGLALTLAAAALAPAWLPQVASASTLWLMAPAVPLVTFIGVVVAATRARFTQTWDVVLQGVARPLLIIAFAAAFALGAPALPQWGRASVLSQWGRASVPALAASYLLAHLVLAIAAAVVLARHYRWASVLRAARGLPIDRGLLAFAWPQNLNLALFALSGSASVLALGVAGLPPRDIALFGAALRDCLEPAPRPPGLHLGDVAGRRRAAGAGRPRRAAGHHDPVDALDAVDRPPDCRRDGPAAQPAARPLPPDLRARRASRWRCSWRGRC